jgi:hypothetical protein
LQVFKVGGFDVAGGEVGNVGLEGGGRGAVFRWEGVAVGREVGGVPFGGEDGGEGAEGVGELGGYLVFWFGFLWDVAAWGDFGWN